MKTNSWIVMKWTPSALALMLGLAVAPGYAALTDIAPGPLANSTTSVVKPNMLFILDDSGSMNNNYLPDYVRDNMCKNNAGATTTLNNCQAGDIAFNSPDFNGVYYNPDIYYKPAVNADGTSKTSYNTNALWQATKNDAYDAEFTGTNNLLNNFPELVWCNTNSPTATDLTPPFASGKCKRELSGGTLSNGTLSGGTWTYPDGTFSRAKAAVTGAADPNMLNPYYYRIASVQWCSTRDNLGFGNGTCQLKKTSTYQYPKYGAVTRTDIVTGNTYPKGSNRSDCAASTSCTYAEEMTNFANWYAYYRTRMMMMKTAAGLAFKTIDDRFRVGFITINPTCQNYDGAENDGNCGSSVLAAKYLKIAPFDATQKGLWYTKFYTQIPDPHTPLRTALSRAGRHYAGKTDAINAGMTDDPIEYSCQQNFTLLTTDGYWNGTNGKELDGTTDMGNYDANVATTPRPLLDGSTLTTAVTTTPTLTQQLCSNNASIFAGGSTCGCVAGSGFKRIRQQTVTATSTVVSRDGVTLSTTPGSSTTYQDITSCDATVTTTVTHKKDKQQALCTGSATVSFSQGGGTTPCGCAANLKRIKQQTRDYDVTQVTTDGSAAAATTGTKTDSFSDITATCDATRVVTTRTPVTISETKICTGSGSVTFADGQSKSCVCSNSSRTVAIKETITNVTITSTTYDGGAPVVVNSGGTTAFTFSTNTTAGAGFSSTNPTSCSSGSLAAQVAAQSTSGGTTTTAPPVGTTISASNITLSPNPQTVTTSGPTSTTTGSTITTANFTIPSGGPVSTTTNTSTSVIGYSNTLADVAQYYYATDLRPNGSLGTPVAGVQLDVGTLNNVPGLVSTDPQKDTAVHQHMTTFTLGLGLDGQLNFAQDYKENPTGDFLAIKNGTKNWPQPVGDTETAIDDLWHAAVNGRGKYFSAKNPSLLASGLSDALASVSAVGGAAAAAATSNLEPVAGDNFAYIASYETVRWNGEIEARDINLTDGSIGTTSIWSAQTQLDTLASATTPGGNNRNIKRFNSSTSTKLEDFTWANLTATEQAYFQTPFISGGGSGPSLSQWATLSAAQQTAASGVNLFNFIRGDSAFEDQVSNSAVGTAPGPYADNRVFRDRQHVLGDVINAQPVYVKQTSVNYADTGFATFKNCVNVGGTGCSTIFNGPRAATVYIAANDGMLHALDGLTGAERWAFVPSILIPKLYRLADKDYANRHQFYVDGSPTVGDVYDSVNAKWRTILVAGLNSGGRGFYALDVTDPANPVGLWEFNVRATASCPSATIEGVDTTDCDLGLSYGNPVITKLGNGNWVVMVTSGYNNVSPGGGKSWLYVLDPITGVIVKKIQGANVAIQGLSPGSATTPAGLAKIVNWVDDSNVNNTTLRVYGGDLQGNLWRFQTDLASTATSTVAYAIAKLKDASGINQPITTKPELGEVNTKAMIYVATGEYLGTTDLATTQVQSIYGVKDDTAGVPPATLVSFRLTNAVAQTLTDVIVSGAAVRTLTANPVDLTTSAGWRVDLPVSGERVNVDPKLQLGTLIVGSNVPTNTACAATGFSFLNFLDYKTGSYIPSASGGFAGIKVGNSLVVGISVVRLPNDKTVAIVTTSDNKHPTAEPPFSTSNPTGHRSLWRELTN